MFELIPLTRSERNMLKEFDRDFYRMEKDFRREEKEIASMRTDIVEKEDCFLLQAELPGFCKEEISIDIEDGCLTIRAVHNDAEEKRNTHSSAGNATPARMSAASTSPASKRMQSPPLTATVFWG